MQHVVQHTFAKYELFEIHPKEVLKKLWSTCRVYLKKAPNTIMNELNF